MILGIWFVFEAIFEGVFLFLYVCIFPQYWCYIFATTEMVTDLIWAPHFFGPKEMWAPKNFDPQEIWAPHKNHYLAISSPNFLGTKLLGAQISWGPNFSGPKFLGDQKKVRGPNMRSRTISFIAYIFGTYLRILYCNLEVLS